MKTFKQISVFSENTQLIDKNLNSEMKNELFKYYREINTNLCEQYPYLTRIIFLALLFQQSVLIYTSRKGQVKDICKNIYKQLGLKQKLYHCNEQTRKDEIFSEVHEKGFYVLFNSLQIQNKIANEIAQYIRESVIIAVQNPKNARKDSFLQEEFDICFIDQFDDNFENFINKINQKTIKKTIDKKQFYENLKKNLEYAQNMRQQEGFFKIYLQLLKLQLANKQIIIPHSKWKNLHRMLKVIGMNKIQHKFKKMSLIDCLLSPMFLSSSVQEYQKITILNQEVIRQKFLKIYGIAKFSKYLPDHFWISPQKKKFWMDRIKLENPTPTFFYPCSKFPNYVSLNLEKQKQSFDIFYKISGSDKKLMCDRYIQISNSKSYKLQLEIKTSHKMLIYIGLACFDKNKKFINTIQICRKKGSQVTFQSYQNNQIKVTSSQNLNQWNKFQVNNGLQPFAYLRSIGIYPDGNIDQLIGIENVFYDAQNAYQVSIDKGAYRSINIQNNKIILNSPTAVKIQQLVNKNILQKGVSKLMNHFEAGTYVIGKLINDNIFEWTQFSMQFEGFSRENTQNKFLESTKYIRIIILSNYNSGYPEFKVENKEAQLSFKNINFYEI